jgi:hypothetical protein
VGSELFRRCREEDAGSDGGTSNALEPKGGASPKQKEKYGKIAPTWEGSLHLALDLFKKMGRLATFSAGPIQKNSIPSTNSLLTLFFILSLHLTLFTSVDRSKYP